MSNKGQQVLRQLKFVAEMELSVGNKAHLDKVISSLKKLREVSNVIRTSDRKV